MQNVEYYFYKLGKIDERLNRKCVNGEYEISITYRLGRLTQRYSNCPTKLQLIHELYREFSYYEFNGSLPNLVVLCLDGHYSHRLLKTIVQGLGYRVPAISLSSTSYNACRIW